MHNYVEKLYVACAVLETLQLNLMSYFKHLRLSIFIACTIWTRNGQGGSRQVLPSSVDRMNERMNEIVSWEKRFVNCYAKPLVSSRRG